MRIVKCGSTVTLDKRGLRVRVVALSIAMLSLGAVVGNRIASAQVGAASTHPVPSYLMEVGQWLCKDWSGLATVQQVGSQRYTFRCKKYATVENIEVVHR